MGRVLLLPIFLFSLSIQAQCPTISEADALQELCKTWVNNIPVPLTVSDLKPEGVTWYTVPSGGDPLPSDHELVDNGIYYAGSETCGGERSSVTASIEMSPVAGRTSQVYICADAEAFDLQERIAPTTDGRASMAEGRFVPELYGGGSVFNPEFDAPGVYAYFVENACGEDDTQIKVFIAPVPKAGGNGTAEFLSTDAQIDLRTFLVGEYDSDGTWSPSLTSGGNTFNPAVDIAQDYTYTVTNSTPLGDNDEVNKVCEASAVVSVNIHQVIDGKVTLCHRGQTMQVNVNALDAHRGHGDVLGTCEGDDPSASATIVAPNPSSGEFAFKNEVKSIKKVRILNIEGGLLKEFSFSAKSNELSINLEGMRPGLYFAEVITPGGKEVLKLMKE